ncbi:MAG: hypothetical protein RLZZ227_354 [Pseudomonadota bacterium]|jgi:CheY-like chemotaxis protein
MGQVTPQLHGHNEVVLLVEDDEMVRMYAHHLLRDLGYRKDLVNKLRQVLGPES